MSTRSMVMLGDSWCNLSEAQMIVVHGGPLVTGVAHAGTIQHWIDTWDTPDTDVSHPHDAINTIIQPGDLVYLSIGGIEQITAVPVATSVATLKTLYDLILSIAGVDIIHAFYNVRIPQPPTDLVCNPVLPVPLAGRLQTGFSDPVALPSIYSERIEWFGFGDLDESVGILVDGLHLAASGYVDRVNFLYARSRFLA